MFKLVIFYIVILFLAGCHSDNREAMEKSEVKFDVNPALLGNEIKDRELGIKFSPPVGWEMLDSAMFAVISEKLSKEYQQETIIVVPKHIFSYEGGKALLAVSSFTASEEDSSSVFKNYSNLLLKKFDSLQLKYAEFTKDGINLRQHLIQTDTHVNFKLLFATGNGKYCQFDYILLRAVYDESKAKAVESSIGSIFKQ